MFDPVIESHVRHGTALELEVFEDEEDEKMLLKPEEDEELLQD